MRRRALLRESFDVMLEIADRGKRLSDGDRKGVAHFDMCAFSADFL
jgi:hypothetical protein